MILRWLCCLALVASPLVEAVEEAPPAPDLRALNAGWWAYFEPAQPLSKSDLKTRIAKNRDSLKQLRLGINDDQGKNFPLFIQQVNEGLDLFANLRDLAVTSPAIPLPLEQYSLAGAAERFMLWRQLQRAFELEQSDLEWQQTQLAKDRKRQAKRRGEYLNLREADPQRLSHGIKLMASRVNLELASLQNKQKAAKLKIVEDQLQHFVEELTSIRLKLVPTPDATVDFMRRQAEAQSKVDLIREKAIEQSYTALLDESLDSDGLKYRALVTATIEIDSAIYELAAKRYQVMAILETRLATQQGGQQKSPDLREAVKKFNDFSTDIKQQAQFWRSLNVQTRKFLAAQNSAMAGEQGALLQRMNTQLEVNDLSLREFELEWDKGNFIIQIAQATLKEDAGWLDRGLFAMDAGFEQGWDQLVEWMGATLIEINEVPLTAMGLLRVILIVFLALLLSKLLGRGLNKLAAHNEVLSPSAIYTLGRVIHYLVLVLGIIIALSSIGLDFTKFALFASALGVGIGFGLQNLIGNFVSGLIILFEKSLKVGDFVELSSGLAGEVKEINMRGTLITTNDNIDIIVPNSDFVNNQVTNWTLRETYRRIHVPFGVAYGSDKDLVKQAALEAADEVKWTLGDDINRKPQVWLVQFGDSSLNFELVVWLQAEAVKRPGAVQAAYLWEIDTKLKKHGIEIPFPQRDLHLRSVFGQKDEAGLPLFSKQCDNEPAHQ
ncbi:MAG: mechanosensitive ion channel [Pseudomonadales bacterium]|nr:mechanosensitive ion channel [Pseudomonadales bacterium]